MILWSNNISLYGYYISFIHSSIDGHIGYFHLLAIMNNAINKASRLALAMRHHYHCHRPACLGFGAPVVGTWVPQHTQLQQLWSLCAVLWKPQCQPGPLLGKDDWAAVGTAIAKTSGRTQQKSSGRLFSRFDRWPWSREILTIVLPKIKFIIEIWSPNVEIGRASCRERV